MTGTPAEPFDLADPALRLRAVAAARGDAPFDRLVSGGTLLDMVTGERREADIGLVGPLIASVHARGARSDALEIVDAAGGYVVPGLIDTHMHVESSMVTPATYVDAVLARGVTTVLPLRVSASVSATLTTKPRPSLAATSSFVSWLLMRSWNRVPTSTDITARTAVTSPMTMARFTTV